ncbi:Eco57I restriction-modification methylase domain-containing protein [Cyclobacterium xiamenense]|uniref:DUF7149 domain-containing protein n=1 Tax=Cyclobacterium xiamenense TaxID=1297121 RepID=UPI0035CF4E9B
MNLNPLKPRKALNKAFLKVKPNRKEIEGFKANLIQLLDRTNDTEYEEFHKNLVRDFLKKTYYEPGHFINTKGRTDLVIHNGEKASSPVGVIIEAKKPTNKSEMVRKEELNAKAFQELVLYYLRERISQGNLEVRHLIITNIHEWFIFDASTFDRLFAQNKKLVQQFTDFEAGRLADTRTDFFYKQIAEPFIAGIDTAIDFTYFHLQEYQKPLRNADKKDDTVLIALFKLLSPEHLLKLPFTNDSNSLDKRFYSELLHIIGLTETKQGGKKLIERNPAGERNRASLLENTIIELDSLEKLSRLERPSQFGATQEEQLFSVALELCITWINRILFLKLLEAQLISYHKGDISYAFLNLAKIKNYDDLNGLFFQVLARKHEQRNEDVIRLFEKVPYLNSSLFEPTDIEQDMLFISNLRNDKTLPILSRTVLKDPQGKNRTGQLTTLEYLFEFLNAYDFSSEGSEDIQEENKSLINASVLGLIFEKINGYKDGSFFTPGFITMYMCRETIRKAVVQKFNEAKGWNCTDLEGLYDKIEDREEANAIVNSLKICDPAVGSGHFLVSALNEMIAVKNDLRILQDREGKRLKEYQVEVVNDELIVTDEDGELFDYNPRNKEQQRIQEALFHEKQTIIENCLFGVDINPNSVKICRLRLWIELLKNAYYLPARQAGETPTELETLPNIDINIKCGNSLVSRFAIDADLSQALKKSKWSIDSYRVAVDTYRNAESKEQKKEMKRLIADIKSDFRSEIAKNDPKIKRKAQLAGELYNLTMQQSMFDEDPKQKKQRLARVAKLEESLNKLETEIEEIKANKIFEDAFEWRFEFPEVLNDVGDFIGFDVVLGNPPYAVVEKERNTPLEPYKAILEYSKSTNRYTEIEGGKQNLYRIFIKLAYDISAEDASFSYIVPLSLIGDNSLFTTRDFIFKNLDNIFFHCFPQKDIPSKRVFEDAKQSTLIIMGNITNNHKKNKKISVFTYPNNSFTDQCKYFEATVNDIKKFDSYRYSVPLVSELEWELLKKLHENPPIREIAEIKVARGEINQSIYRKYISSQESLSRLVKGVEIGKYKLNITLSQGKREYFNERLFTVNGKTNTKAKKRRIATQRITGVDEKLRLVATIIEPDAYFADSTNSIEIDINEGLEFFLGLINSKLLNWRFKKTSSNNNVSTTEIESLPFTRKSDIDFSIIKLVKTVLILKKKNPENETTLLENQIDQLVYILYGLTEEEIKIVEES